MKFILLIVHIRVMRGKP